MLLLKYCPLHLPGWTQWHLRIPEHCFRLSQPGQLPVTEPECYPAHPELQKHFQDLHLTARLQN